MSQKSPSATKIMIIRHAEKPSDTPPPQGVDINGDQDDESLVVRGWQRAGALAVFFAPSFGPMQNTDITTPQTVYASKIGKGSKSERPQETVSPLIAKLGSKAVTTNFNFPKGQEPEVAASAQQCTGAVLICWEHEHIPAIATNLPMSPNNKNPVPSAWPGDDRFDVVWIFDLDQSASGGYLFNAIPQLLLAGDTPLK